MSPDPVWTDGVTPLNQVNMVKLQTRDEKAVVGGYASLDGAGKVPAAQLPVTNMSVAAKTGSYTLALADGENMVEMNVAGANTATVPTNAVAAFPVGTQVTIAQQGAGQTTIGASGGVTLRAYNGNLKLAGQYAVCTVIKRATDEWYVSGNLVP